MEVGWEWDGNLPQDVIGYRVHPDPICPSDEKGGGWDSISVDGIPLAFATQLYAVLQNINVVNKWGKSAARFQLRNPNPNRSTSQRV
jgi:hypothetical protein